MEVKAVQPDRRAALVRFAKAYSDKTLIELDDLAKAFIASHGMNPGGLTLDIGTRQGGSALLFLGLLELMGLSSMVFTIDPYGGKPYEGGDGAAVPLYDVPDYLVAKRVLAPFPNHAHWYCSSEMFLGGMACGNYWWQGTVRHIDSYSFVFLDGEHTAQSVGNDLAVLWELMQPGASVVVDNAHKDPNTKEALAKYRPTYTWFSDDAGTHNLHALLVKS